MNQSLQSPKEVYKLFNGTTKGYYLNKYWTVIDITVKTVLAVSAIICLFFGVSEYVDNEIKDNLSRELNIDKEHITFLYGKGDMCEEDQTLWDSKLGICIDNIAFEQFTDTDVGM